MPRPCTPDGTLIDDEEEYTAAPQRYDVYGFDGEMMPADDGEFVEYKYIAALVAEVERLRSECQRLDDLAQGQAAEIEQLKREARGKCE